MKQLQGVLEGMFGDNFGVDADKLSIGEIFKCQFEKTSLDAMLFSWDQQYLEKAFEFFGNKQLLEAFGYQELPKKDPLRFWKDNFANGVRANNMYIVGYHSLRGFKVIDMVIPLDRSGSERNYYCIRSRININQIVAEPGVSRSMMFMNVKFAYKVPKKHAIEILKIFRSEDYISKLK